jgi:hypothetical protein
MRLLSYTAHRYAAAKAVDERLLKALRWKQHAPQRHDSMLRVWRLQASRAARVIGDLLGDERRL